MYLACASSKFCKFISFYPPRSSEKVARKTGVIKDRQRPMKKSFHQMKMLSNSSVGWRKGYTLFTPMTVFWEGPNFWVSLWRKYERNKHIKSWPSMSVTTCTWPISQQWFDASVGFGHKDGKIGLKDVLLFCFQLSGICVPWGKRKY